ncbi:cbb3-type cytochrome oxidase assembly protein CcoS [Persicobacter sp. CCB-QB2]|uniref:cbb3-type cytochrome oxidase assembly protein CcoS n=1 Tax=Persicobacter sp. CCB-QB2 TaxID=1561025 RepID=UPI0006A953BB|nr:cbb3-type cytochrome oxidase assembly protein CcoS [Persicobacter sp. CCB-QB2]
MSVIFILISISILVAIIFLAAFFWSVKSGQYEDTVSPGVRILFEERKSEEKQPASQAEEQDTDQTKN